MAFAINQQMHQLTELGLTRWLNNRRTGHPLRIGVLNAGNVPFVGLQDLLAVLLTGHRYLGSVSSKSPYLLPAFIEDLQARVPERSAAFVPAEEVLALADGIIATGNDTTRSWVAEQCDAQEISPHRRLIRGHRFGVAVLDGTEDLEARSGLAEDVLLHEGYGCRNVALIWAPKGLDPDPYFDTMAQFRLVFPAHPDMHGVLRMPRAFLESTNQPHAIGDGFLISRGAPDVQQPGHIRWVAYENLNEVRAWLNAETERIQVVVAAPHVAETLDSDLNTVHFGDAQRPKLDWCPDGVDLVSFLSQLT